jgi:5-methylcytosine-specific restriction endonuclease McrA
MKPFDQYPEDGLRLLPKVRGDNARHGYGLQLQRLTGQTTCAYCGVSLVDDYDHWLLLAVDHVIPVEQCERLGFPDDWRDSYSNRVLSCSGCNGFDNKYLISWDEPNDGWTLDRFFSLRNRVFKNRKARIHDRRAKEIMFFQSRPWEK